jgi:glycosyltransferase involved in cell wall biosynthesis
MKKSNVTVVLQVYNEEERLEACLKNFAWAQELIVLVKESADLTLEIAHKYATEVISLPFSSTSEDYARNFSNRGTCDWLLFPTASSLIHPELVAEIVKLTYDKEFPYDVIGLPYGIYCMGIRSKHSPWFDLRKYTLIRRSVLTLSNEMHQEVGYRSDRIYDMPLMAPDQIFYHCTNKDPDDLFLRHLRYTKYESQSSKIADRNQVLRRAFYVLIKSVFNGLFRRRTFMLGWDGIALSLAYISYFLMKFVYEWDSYRDNGTKTYPLLTKQMEALWEAQVGSLASHERVVK